MVTANKRLWLLAITMVVALAWSAPAVADEEAEQLRVALTEVPGGGENVVARQLGEISGVDVMYPDEFVDEVESRAFDPETILDDPSDLEWVMDGGDIGIVIDFEEAGETEYRVRFITAEDARPEHDFLTDRGADGSMSRGGAALVRLELQDFVDRQPDVVTEALGDVEVADDEEADEEDDEPVADPDALREAAAEDEAERREIFARDWLWFAGHLRIFQKDFSAAAPQAVYTLNSGGFFGYELDVEAFPFSPMNPDLAPGGFYVNYNHGLYDLTIEDRSGEEVEEHEVSINNLTLEGGALYRLDSPLDDSNRQIRFKLGGRYETFSVTENPEIPSTSMTSLVLGTRLVLPVGAERFAIKASADATPVARFSQGAQLFGSESFSYGFGAELGMLVELMDGGFLSGGYTFRMMYSDFEGEGDEVFDEARSLVFEDSEVFDLNHGLRLGFVVQY